MRARSSVLSGLYRVGKSTSCSRPKSWNMCRYVSFTADGFWLPAIDMSFHWMSGRLKSPPARMIADLCMFAISHRLSMHRVAYSRSELGGAVCSRYNHLEFSDREPRCDHFTHAVWKFNFCAVKVVVDG